MQTSSNSVAECENVSTSEKINEVNTSLKKIEQKLNVRSPKTSGVVDLVVGSQWGDEGKGKLVDIVSQKYDVCARVAGGSNAGHTIVANVRTSKFRIFQYILFNNQINWTSLGEKI